MKSSHTYLEEDWLVHSHHGIGQIKCIEKKGISGAAVNYFRIQTTDSIYWVPVDQMDSEMMRPVTTLEEIQLAIAILERPPKEMSPDYKVRKTRIQHVQLQNTPEDVARLVRDLHARQRDKGQYNLDENNVIRALKQRLVEEWSVVTGKNKEHVTSSLNALLDHPHLEER